MVLRSSKTHSKWEAPQLVKISGYDMNANNEGFQNKNERFRYCPYQILSDYMDEREVIRTNNKALLIFRDGKTVKAQNFRTFLKKMINQIGLDESNYDTHSLRLGRAMDLVKMGLSIEEIKTIGRWKSNAVYTYLNNLQL